MAEGGSSSFAGPSTLVEYERCDCDWFGAQTDAEIPCGCGAHACRLYRDEVIHRQGKHWRMECGFRAALQLLAPAKP